MPRVGLLPAGDAAFLGEFVLAGFSIKALEERLGLSYPAIRARLDSIMTHLRKLSVDDNRSRRILDRLERGEIGADEAVRLIEAL